MATLIVRHRVRNYEAWKPVFDEHGTVRRQHGCLGHEVYRGAGDPEDVLIVFTFRDAAGIEGFAADPSLREAMDRAGVVSQPEITAWDQADVADYTVAVG